MRLLFCTLSVFVWAGGFAQTDSLFTETPQVLHTPTGDLFGTLTVPKKGSKGTVALIIAGSGPTDRNGNNMLMKNESLRQLAYALATAGVASLRYDKRAIGESAKAAKSEADLRFGDFIDDARGWLQQLKRDRRFTRLVVVGHSEGSLIGMVAAQGLAQGFVSLAGAGRPIDAVLKEQLAAQPAVFKDPAYVIIDSLKAGYTVASVPPALFSLFRPSVQPYMISWMRYDPAAELRKLNMPVLVVQGTTDIQVSVEDGRLLAAANPQSQLLLVPGMNHIFRTVSADRKANIATYTQPDLPLNDVMVAGLLVFLKKLEGRKSGPVKNKTGYKQR